MLRITPLHLRATVIRHYLVQRTRSLTNIAESFSIKKIAKRYREESGSFLSAYTHLRPKLVSILANNDPEALKYSESTRRSCESIGIQYETLHVSKPSFSSSGSFPDVETAILNANTNPSIHAVQVYYPVGPPTFDKHLQNLVVPEKDVEGLCGLHQRNMFNNVRWMDVPRNTKKGILPCTPLAIIKILEHLGIYRSRSQGIDRLRGCVVTVINRSEIVGRPLAALLANDGATVYSVDIDSVQMYSKGMDLCLKKFKSEELKDRKLQDVVPLSDVVITGVSDSKFRIPTKLLKTGTVAINFSNFNNFESNVREKASIYISGIGPVTVAMLQRNVIRLACQTSPSSLVPGDCRTSTLSVPSNHDVETYTRSRVSNISHPTFV